MEETKAALEDGPVFSIKVLAECDDICLACPHH